MLAVTAVREVTRHVLVPTGTALGGAGSITAGSTAVMWAPNRNTSNQWTLTAV